MAPSLTATMSASASQLLPSSISNSASSPRHGSSQISKIYRQASTLFLTRRLPESLSTILPVITSPTSDDLNGDSSHKEPAPIAGASRTTRIKVWSLYLTILNAVVELDPDEGKQAFGSQEWRALVSKVREGEVWEEVASNGYGGVEGDVDSDVVINLATLLLAHARTQELNQTRLEAYLASSTRPNLDISSRLTHDGQTSPRRPGLKSNGTDTPRDLNARVKILELYTLHVLLRNNEWDYAREFITISSVLDEERREAFLAALQSLQNEQAEVANREQEAQRRQDEQLENELEEARKRRLENEKHERERQQQERERKMSMSERAGSEVDYGIDDHASWANGSVNGSTKARSVKASSVKGTSASKPSRPPVSKVSHASRPSVSGKKTVAPPGLFKRAGAIIANLRTLLENTAVSFKGNPMVLLRTLAFMVAFLILISRRDVKERIKRMWAKVMATAGMGVKVSYI